MKKKLIPIIILVFLIIYPTFSAITFDGGGNKIDDYKKEKKRILKAKKLEKKGKIKKSQILYKESLKYLFKAHDQKPGNPDILNYLGFSIQKTGNLEDAEIYYLLGLVEDPKHKGINKYLGELYTITNRTDMAKERLNVLKSCNCKEYKQLKEIIEGIK